MPAVEVYSKSIELKCKSTLLSKATIFHLLSVVLAVVLPFIFAYKSGGLWLKRDVFYEQPNVKFKGSYIFVATTTDLTRPIICTTFKFPFDLEKFDSCSLIKVREVDNNFDGKFDFIQFSLSTPIAANITSIGLILFMDYLVTSTCSLQMESAIIYQQYLSFFLSDLKVYADLNFHQIEAIKCNNKYANTIFNESIITGRDLHILDSLAENYFTRNFATRLQNVLSTNKITDLSTFRLDLTVRYPEDKFVYKPRFWHIVKWCWVQYYAIFIIVAWFIRKIRAYIFDNRLVLFYKEPLTLKS